MLHEQPRQLTKGLFEAVGLVRNLRRIHFDDFVICIATVATWSKSELLHYAFKQFDVDESGVMDGRELRAFCEGLKNDSSFYFESQYSCGSARFSQRIIRVPSGVLPVVAVATKCSLLCTWRAILGKSCATTTRS
ncbi:uncharacterized protein PITG_22155 [Phytophthora infestans T30-4]|uniref:EF-hand domain-containing protein n=1 Tax=Phytophthora infestans (strain T30-4) TaxID=403677 RepID=D0RLX5_PHYIT|nr:uncharacterized protein PITG_22155 [Phytophthora infestans T30-4]EEY55105.1 conserved hypothetical protein [Phytophthora infestans T30-4]|eukprot:XP_002909955.1 conserved hypothetical protein [Phytophthora infestans T30-4]